MPQNKAFGQVPDVILSLFLQSKCVIDALDSSGRTALHHAGKNLSRFPGYILK